MTPRTRTQRRADALATLQRGGDVWVASANTNGTAHLVALTYFWDGERLTVVTPQRNKTARNLTRSRWSRVALNLTDDVVILEGSLEVIPVHADEALAADYVTATGYDIRREPEPWMFFRMTPTRIQAMRSPEEEPDRTIIRDGRWLGDKIMAGRTPTGDRQRRKGEDHEQLFAAGNRLSPVPAAWTAGNRRRRRRTPRRPGRVPLQPRSRHH